MKKLLFIANRMVEKIEELIIDEEKKSFGKNVKKNMQRFS